MEPLTYEDIFGKLVHSAYGGFLGEEMEKLRASQGGQYGELVKYAAGQGNPRQVVFKVKDCSQDEGCEENKCQVACLFNAIARDEKGYVVIKDDYCTNCGKCVEVCDHGNIIDKKEFVPLVNILKDRKKPVFAIMAPAFIGQFGEGVTPGKLRAALKRLGFYGMVEVALFADMLTLKEALEFDLHVQEEGDFVLTSCCCPMWVAMIKKIYSKLIPRISPSVSPMVACGRGLKKIHPEAKVVFIGPCVAKKAEAKDSDVDDAIDAVITFEELSTIFAAVGVNPELMEEDSSEHSSTSGRVYARTGGVSRAVAETLQRLRPEREIQISSAQANGVKECRKMLQDALDGRIEANFYEGMGCVGGCVGGPKANLDTTKATEVVNRYGDMAENRTPADNQYVLELLKSLGIMEIPQLLEGEKAEMFQRNFK